MGDPRSWGDDPEAFDRRSWRSRAPSRSPTSTLDYPPWLEDLRKHWVTDDS